MPSTRAIDPLAATADGCRLLGVPLGDHDLRGLDSATSATGYQRWPRIELSHQPSISAELIAAQSGGSVTSARPSASPAVTIARHAKIVDRLEERVFRRVDDLLDVARHLATEATDLVDLGSRRTAGVNGRRWPR